MNVPAGNSTMVNDKARCVSWCRAYPAATACQFRSGWYCFVYTSSDVARGDVSAAAKCWILSQCEGEFIYDI